jgi:hypothetical protein
MPWLCKASDMKWRWSCSLSTMKQRGVLTSKKYALLQSCAVTSSLLGLLCLRLGSLVME